MFRVLVPCGKGWADPENPLLNEGKKRKSTELPVEEAEEPKLHSPLLERLFLHDICATAPLYTVQGLSSFCRFNVGRRGAWPSPTLTPRACHPPRSLLTCLRLRIQCNSIKHLIIIRQTGAAAQRHQLSMACYLRLINQRPCRRKSQQPRQGSTTMESFQPPFAPSPIVPERDELPLLPCPAMGLRRRHIVHTLLVCTAHRRTSLRRHPSPVRFG